MDSSDDVMVASGRFFIPVEEAWGLLRELSLILTSAGFPHEIGIDDEEGNRRYSCAFLWSE